MFKKELYEIHISNAKDPRNVAQLAEVVRSSPWIKHKEQHLQNAKDSARLV